MGLNKAETEHVFMVRSIMLGAGILHSQPLCSGGLEGGLEISYVRELGAVVCGNLDHGRYFNRRMSANNVLAERSPSFSFRSTETQHREHGYGNYILSRFLYYYCTFIGHVT